MPISSVDLVMGLPRLLEHRFEVADGKDARPNAATARAGVPAERALSLGQHAQSN
jgi:hypothetical protein